MGKTFYLGRFAREVFMRVTHMLPLRVPVGWLLDTLVTKLSQKFWEWIGNVHLNFQSLSHGLIKRRSKSPEDFASPT